MRFNLHALCLLSIPPGILTHPHNAKDDSVCEVSTLLSTVTVTTYTKAYHQYPMTSVATAVTTTDSSPSSVYQSSTPSSVAVSNTLSVEGCSYWLEDIQHQGVAAFNSDSSYQVFRNIKDFGAKGDGVTDDTNAINAAISSGNRCAPGSCSSSSTSPALIYFPAGTYLVSGPIIDYYDTQLVGNPNCLPVIKASSSFSGAWIIDGDQYQPGGAQGWLSTNIFWRQIRNFVFDTTAVDSSINIRAIHWPTGQASSLQNIIFHLSAATGTQHEGLFIENGSGGFITDLVFNGGLNGADLGNQQFTVRNLTFNNCVTAITQLWDWGWTYQGITVNSCGTGIDLTALVNGIHAVGSVVLIDSTISNTPIGIKTVNDGTTAAGTYAYPNIILENVNFQNVPTILQSSSNVLIPGSSGSTFISAWGQGHSYTPNGPKNIQGPITPNSRPSSLLSPNGFFYTQSKPQYSSYPASKFLSARSAGARGDGQTDDTTALQTAISNAAQAGKVLFVDAGTYKVTSSLYVPAGSKIVGEAYAVIMSSGSFFENQNNPQPVVQIGKKAESGHVEWSDMIVSTQGATAGAILIEWNLAGDPGSPSGIWDVHTRIGGTLGSNLQVASCQKNPNPAPINSNCIAAFMSMHITSSACGLYMENNWFWVADHDVDDPSLTQISVYAGRGLLVESKSANIWMYGTAVEHHTLYQYQVANVPGPMFMGFIQTESPYYQPNPAPPTPFTSLKSWNDPVFEAGSNTTSAWGLRMINSPETLIYGAGLYSFYNNYDVTCSNQGNGEWCQQRILSIEDTSKLSIYGLQTVGTKRMTTINGNDDASYADNINGFSDAIALFRLS